MRNMCCQSCAMPFWDSKEAHGTNADGSVNADYCGYCYQDGEFTNDCTMEEIIELCVALRVSHPDDEIKMSEGVAMDMMSSFIPTLKRWR